MIRKAAYAIGLSALAAPIALVLWLLNEARYEESGEGPEPEPPDFYVSDPSLLERGRYRIVERVDAAVGEPRGAAYFIRFADGKYVYGSASDVDGNTRAVYVNEPTSYHVYWFDDAHAQWSAAHPPEGGAVDLVRTYAARHVASGAELNPDPPDFYASDPSLLIKNGDAIVERADPSLGIPARAAYFIRFADGRYVWGRETDGEGKTRPLYLERPTPYTVYWYGDAWREWRITLVNRDASSSVSTPDRATALCSDLDQASRVWFWHVS